MTSLNIQQSTLSSETVSSAVIEKLYNLAIISTVEDENSTLDILLTGSIYANAAYETSVLYLREKFPQLTINIRDNNYYIKFADPKVEQILVASQYCSDGIGFSLNDASLMPTIPRGLFAGSLVTIKIETFDELNKFGSISLANGSFDNNPNLTSINLSTVTSIGDQAFYDCTGLSMSVNIPNLTSIGLGAFRSTGITRVVNLGSTISSLPSLCFRMCQSLAEINIPQTVTSIGFACFLNCVNLASFDFSNISSIAEQAFCGCTSLTGQISIPNLSGELEKLAFKGCTGITSFTNLGTITSFGLTARDGYEEGVFAGCTSLTSIVIPNTVTTIGCETFSGCDNLTLITCNWQNITTLSSRAFAIRCNWNFILPLLNLTNIGHDVFCLSRTSRTIKLIYLPKIRTGLAQSSFQNTTYYRGNYCGIVADILYLRDVEKLYPASFTRSNIINLVINNTIPPIWCNYNDLSDDSAASTDSYLKKHVFSGSTVTNIYVPDSAVSVYTSDSNWSTVADKIKPLSQLTKVATEADLQEGQIALIEAYM